MWISEHEQGTEEWKMERLGIATASRFGDIMTMAKFLPAKNMYLFELVAEAISGEMVDWGSSEHTERGTEMEPEAVAFYELVKDVNVTAVGLCKPTEDSRYGFSPDGLIDDDGGLEVKCPSLKYHAKYLVDGVVPSAYKPQVYGSLYGSGRDYWDFISYHPQAKPLIVRTTKDDPAYIKWRDAFDPVLAGFIARLDEAIEATQQ